MNEKNTSKTYGYARVSTMGQNLDRQFDLLHEAGIDDADIFADKVSGKDFERPAWKKLMRRLSPGDVLVVTSLDRFGRKYDEMTSVWGELVHTRNIHIRVLDMPILDTTIGQGLTAAFIGDLVLRVLSYVAETERAHIRQRQREGIAAAKSRGVRFGRPPIQLPPEFAECVRLVQTHKLSVRAASKRCLLPRSTFYRYMKTMIGNDRRP